MSNPTAAITAVHGYLPPDVLTNFDLEKMVDTTDEWIRTRTGVQERHILKGEGLGTSDMGAEAVKGLLAKRGIDASEIDLLIYKKVIVVGADKMSSIIDYTDRATCIIFGDGAGAVLLEPTEEGTGVLDSILKADGSGRQYLHQKAGGSVKPASHETVDNKEHYVFQDGQPVFKAAVKGMADVSAEIMEKNNLAADDVAWLVPHQANLRIIDATANRMGVGPEKVMVNIQRYGNTTAGTIPLCLWDWEKQLKKGDNIILAAFGGGFTWGAVYVKWAYNTPQ